MKHAPMARLTFAAALVSTTSLHAQQFQAPELHGVSAPNAILAPTCGAAPTTTTTFNGSGGPIFNGSFATYTCTVSGLGASLWDIDLTTAIAHPACFDLDVQLIAPSGKTVTVTTDNGGVNDDVFNGTLWDDNVNAPVTDHVFTNLVTATPLSPEGRLSAFRGENPNGVWTLRIADDSQGNTGSLSSWSLAVSALASTPSGSQTTIVRTPNAAIPDGGSFVDTLNFSGPGAYIAKVELYTELPHARPVDLDVRLISPAGTAVWVTTDGGGTFANVFDGTLWNPSSTAAATDFIFAANVVATELSPEGSFDNFLGQNPNGTWTLEVFDDQAGSLGSLDRWELRVTTIANPGAPSKPSFAGASGTIPDAGGAPPTLFTLNVAGQSGLLWDVDVFTAIAHTLNADIDMSLISPAGTTVTLTTDNGFTSNIFNGSTWDDNVNAPVTDYPFTANVPATPISPEGRLSAFRGETPNGTWTLSITDDAALVAGTLSSWSLGLTTIGGLPGTSATTFSSTPNLIVPDVATVTDAIAVAGLTGTVSNVKVYVELPHTWSNDLDLLLIAPNGTTVALSTDNGNDFDDVFNGTLFDVDAPIPVTDYAFVDLVAAPLVSPEGPLDMFVGLAPNGAWTLSVTDDFSPDTGTLVRWDLTIETCTLSQPTAYCAPTGSGTSSGCLPTIQANSNPNVANSAPCTIDVANVEGQKTGIIFYGVSGATNLPWCTGANTAFCVKSPTQRTVPQNSGGAVGQCNGALNLDWSAYQLANPTALGNPWTVGAKAYVQSWFRDPPSCKTTFLSEALELTYVP
jgi:subtilisin-like proprotein convertase family protein